MTRRVRARRALGTGAVTLLVIAMSPAVLLAGEAVNRHYLRGRPARYPRDRVAVRVSRYGPVIQRRVRIRRPRGEARVAGYALGPRKLAPAVALLLTNPVWIALTAPARWVLDHLRPRVGGRNGNGGNGGPGAGVREPRRPLPDPPAGAIALPEPYQPG